MLYLPYQTISPASGYIFSAFLPLEMFLNKTEGKVHSFLVRTNALNARLGLFFCLSWVSPEADPEIKTQMRGVDMWGAPGKPQGEVRGGKAAVKSVSESVGNFARGKCWHQVECSRRYLGY